MQFILFTKPLGSLSLEALAEQVATCGYDGVDLTVRPKGHVDPQNVRAELPHARDILRDRGLTIGLATTGITEADDPVTEPTFAALAECGVRHAKLGYWPFDPARRLREQIDEVRRRLDGIEALARKHGVTACVHTHSGDMMTAVGAVVAQLLKGRDPRVVGVQLDPGHLTVEGGLGGWKQSLDLLREHTAVVAVKAFRWFHEDTPSGPRQRARMAPLQDGMVNWRDVFGVINGCGFDGVVTIDSPPEAPQTRRPFTVHEILAQATADLRLVREVAGRALVAA
jgi:sugar phosphate isomerase/epimerase